MDCNFDQVPTEILEEEINRRRAVIDFRTARAEELLTETAKMVGAPTYGTFYATAYLFRVVGCTMLNMFFLLCVLAYFTSPMRETLFLQVGGIALLIGLIWFPLLNKESKRVKKEFLRRHPEEAKLLGYKK